MWTTLQKPFKRSDDSLPIYSGVPQRYLVNCQLRGKNQTKQSQPNPIPGSPCKKAAATGFGMLK